MSTVFTVAVMCRHVQSCQCFFGDSRTHVYSARSGLKLRGENLKEGFTTGLTTCFPSRLTCRVSSEGAAVTVSPLTLCLKGLLSSCPFLLASMRARSAWPSVKAPDVMTVTAAAPSLLGIAASVEVMTAAPTAADRMSLMIPGTPTLAMTLGMPTSSGAVPATMIATKTHGKASPGILRMNGAATLGAAVNYSDWRGAELLDVALESVTNLIT